MPKQPPSTELEFLKITGNFREFARKLDVLGVQNHDTVEYAEYICIAWFELGRQHLGDATKLLRSQCPRAAFSRAYYAAYNASKGVRYLTNGNVSLKGDDHGKASIDLPDDFPDIASWTTKISQLYEHRLRADYDNWATSATENEISSTDAVRTATEFIEEARNYLNSKFNLTL